jgi:hypothetical protein
MSESKRRRDERNFARPSDSERANRKLMRLTLFASLALTLCTSLVASGEEVVLRTIVHDKAILIRNSQEWYLIQTTPHCPSLAGYQGKTVFLLYTGNHSPEPGAHLLLRSTHRRCRIAQAAAVDPLGDSTVRPKSTGFSPPLLAIQEGLLLLGRDPGTIGEQAGTMKVLDTIRGNYGFDSSLVGLKKTVRALAVELISQKPADARAREISRKLLNMAFAPESPVVVPGS